MPLIDVLRLSSLRCFPYVGQGDPIVCVFIGMTGKIGSLDCGFQTVKTTICSFGHDVFYSNDETKKRQQFASKVQMRHPCRDTCVLIDVPEALRREDDL
ncbi:MAG TPA: hypothetical protein PKO36_09715 [Candidatus Hydrogenedentes bacterium]|nr:hypothetical protein [Candidatus Hydrogenedentota bacterium]HOV75849.1 hypothetical protein [Candidatus Hydrogenedentota bacterium]